MGGMSGGGLYLATTFCGDPTLYMKLTCWSLDTVTFSAHCIWTFWKARNSRNFWDTILYLGSGPTLYITVQLFIARSPRFWTFFSADSRFILRRVAFLPNTISCFTSRDRSAYLFA